MTTPPAARVSAVDIATALHSLNPSAPKITPTPQQQAMIEAPPEPLVVVAGAGSGKTQTMSARVLWSVANGFVSPRGVLGLTFTRKAAGELAERVSKQLALLARVGLLDSTTQELLEDSPTQLTYHSFANQLVAEHGLLVGLEPGSGLLNAAGSHALATDVLTHLGGDVAALGMTKPAVARAIVSLGAAMAEHLLEPGDIADHANQVVSLWESLPYNDEGGEFALSKPGKDPDKVLQAMRKRPIIAQAVAAFAARKREAKVLDFGDLVALAARLAANYPDVVASQRERFGLVLLDEFQDTSVAQLTLLSRLFGGGMSVTAVGDPNQAIYAWRGASAANLDLFRKEFRHNGVRPPKLYLSTSFRNDEAILNIANRIVSDVGGDEPGDHGNVPDVEPLSARPGAGPGQVWTRWFGVVPDEVEAVAQWIGERFAPGQHTAAILCRSRSSFPALEAELTKRGIPCEVVGGGGLLHRPEVQDIIALFTLAVDPDHGPSLARLFLHSRFHVDAQATAALHETAVKFGDRRNPAMAKALDSLVDKEPDDPLAASLGETSFRRLQHLGRELRWARAQENVPIPDVIADMAARLSLPTELEAEPGADVVSASAHIAELVSQARSYVATSPVRTMAGFVAWLDLAMEYDRGLDEADIPAEHVNDDSAVTLCTVHASKGLEWDSVAVVDVAKGRFPVVSKGLMSDLIGVGAIPNNLRGDKDSLPCVPWNSLPTCLEVESAIGEHRELMKEDHEAGERRLAYVAVTRARTNLWISGAAKNLGGKTDRKFSPYMEQTRDELCGDPCHDESGTAEEPIVGSAEGQAAELVEWPHAGWSVRNVPVRTVAEAVQSATGSDVDAALEQAVREATSPQVKELLLQAQETAHEWDQRTTQGTSPRVTHVSASHLAAMANDPEAYATNLVRPVPREPRYVAHRGTEFHAWIERHYGLAQPIDGTLPPGLDIEGEVDEPLPTERALVALQEAFLASPWAAMTPTALEVPIEFELGSVVIRGRIDAVFSSDDGTYTLVDWKSGRAPSGEAGRMALLQLAAYRYAWELAHPGSDVKAAYFYAASRETVWVPPMSADELSEVVAWLTPQPEVAISSR